MRLSRSVMALLALQPVCTAPAVARDVVYRVKPGDSLWQLATRYLAPGHDYRDLQRRNHIADPHRLVAGTRIAIPSEWLRRDAQTAALAAYRGEVRVTVAGRNHAPSVGMELPSRSSVETLPRAFASLTLPDGSLLSILPGSLVRINGLSRVRLIDVGEHFFAVEHGRVEARVSPADQVGRRFEISTPLAVASVRGTQFRTKYRVEAQQLQVEVLKGSVEVRGPGDTLLGAGEAEAAGSSGMTARGRLLAAPELLEPGRIQDGDELTFGVAPMAGAVRWHLILAADAGFVGQIDEIETDAATLHMAAPSDGTYFVRLAAISPEGFEGQSRDYAVRRDRYRFSASQSASVEGGQVRYRFRWLPEAYDSGQFRFILRRQGEDVPPLVDKSGLTGSELSVTDLPPGTYRWSVGRWSGSPGDPRLVWDDEHELVVAR